MLDGPKFNENHWFRSRGVTLIEAMVVLGLVAMTFTAVLPLFSASPKFAAYSDARLLCQRLAKGKLDALKAGITLSAGAVMFEDYLMSFHDFSFSSYGPPRFSGFDYLKFIYNQNYTAGICNGESAATLFDYLITIGHPPVLGLRACAAPVTAAVETFGTDALPPVCTDATDVNAQTVIPGFKLYVKMELSTPWSPNTGPHWVRPGMSQPDTSFVMNGRRYVSNCPDDQAVTRTGNMPACAGLNCNVHYDFSGHSDAIKITVTGVMDVASAEGGGLSDLGNVGADDAERLTCQASSTVYPNRPSLIRYFVNREGVIQWGNEANYSTSLVNRNPFKNVSRQGIVAISAHPRNFGIWVLKEGGELTRYGNCGGVPINCDTQTYAADAVMDDGSVGVGQSVITYHVPPSIRMIGVDYRNLLMYGMTKGGGTIYEIRKAGGGSVLTDLGCAPAAASDPACGTDLIEVSPSPLGGTPTPVWNTGTFPARVTGFFLSPDGSSGYASDRTNDTFLVPGNDQYFSSTIYWTNYPKLTAPVASIPFDAVSFSP